MTGAIIAIAVAIFVTGVAAGIVVIVTIGIKREERDFHRTGRISVTRQAPDRISDGTRSLTGLYVRHRTDLEDPAAIRYQDTLV